MAAPRLFERHLRIDAMELVEIDHVDAEPAERCLDRLADVLRARVVVQRVAAARADDESRLGRHHRAFPVTLERAPHELLVRERAVDVGGIQQRHPQVERSMDHRDRLRLGRVADVGPVHGHAAEPDLTDLRWRSSRASSSSSLRRLPSRARCDVVRVGVGHEERREPASLVDQARSSRGRQPHDRLDGDPCRGPLARRASIVPRRTRPPGTWRSCRGCRSRVAGAPRCRSCACGPCSRAARCRTRAGTAPAPACRRRAAAHRARRTAPGRPRRDTRGGRGRSRSTTSLSFVSPHHAWMSMTAAGPYPARYRMTRSSIEGSASSGRPSQDSAVVHVACPLCPHTPRGGTWTTGSR